MSKCEIRLLGKVAVGCAGRTADRFPTAKTEQLFVYLALRANEDCPRYDLGEALWPGSKEKAVRHRLNQAASAIRRILRGIAAPAEVRSSRSSLRLDVDPGAVDALAFEQMSRSARVEDRVAGLLAYRGPLAPGHRATWIERHRVRLATKMRAEAQELTRVATVLGDDALLARIQNHIEDVATAWDFGVSSSISIPRLQSPLVGRQAELAEICDAIRLGSRTLVVAGVAGSGKTSLGLELIARIGAEFGAVRFVRSGSQVPPAVDDDSLLVMDDAQMGQPRPEGGTVVAFSREPLDWAGVRQFLLSGIPERDAVALLRAKLQRQTGLANATELSEVANRMGRLPGLLARFVEASRSRGFSAARREAMENDLAGPRIEVPAGLKDVLTALSCAPGGLEPQTLEEIVGHPASEVLNHAVGSGLAERIDALDDRYRLAPGVVLLIPKTDARIESDFRSRLASRLEQVAVEFGRSDPSRLVADVANFSSVLDWMQARGEIRRALQLALSLTRVWEFSGRTLEGRVRVEGLLEGRPRLPASLIADAWRAMADLGWQSGALTLADASLRRSAREDPKVLALSAGISHSLGDYEGAIAVARAAIRQAERQEDLETLARAWAVVGHSATERQMFCDAWDAYGRSIDFARLLGDPVRISASLINLGNLAGLCADFALGRSLLDEAEQLARSIGHLARRADVALTRTGLEIESGRPERAATLILDALAWDALPAHTRLQFYTVAGQVLLSIGDAEHGVRLMVFGRVERRKMGGARQRLERVAYDGYACAAKARIGSDGYDREARRGRMLDDRRALELCRERLRLVADLAME